MSQYIVFEENPANNHVAESTCGLQETAAVKSHYDVSHTKTNGCFSLWNNFCKDKCINKYCLLMKASSAAHTVCCVVSTQI